MIQSFRYQGKRYHLIPNEEMNHYVDSDKNIFLIGDIFTETSLRKNSENDIDSFIKMGIWLEPKENRSREVISRMGAYRGFYDRVYSQDVKQFYSFIED